MTPRKRPSGAGSNSTRFASVEVDGKTLKIPAVKDAGTFIYVSDNEIWPKSPTTILLIDAAWIREGASFGLKEMRPGRGMGTVTQMVVINVRMMVSVHPGKYGQIERHVLVNPSLDMDELSKLLAGG